MSEKITVYHTTDSYTIHKGPKALCRTCKQQRSRKTLVDNKKSGSAGGKISGKNRSNPPRRCKDCKKPIHRQSKSGRCLPCLRIQRKKDAVTRKARAKKKRCSVCNKPIARINKTGLCRKCWNKASKTKAGRQQLQAWVNAAVFSRNATPRDNDDGSNDTDEK